MERPPASKWVQNFHGVPINVAGGFPEGLPVGFAYQSFIRRNLVTEAQNTLKFGRIKIFRQESSEQCRSSNHYRFSRPPVMHFKSLWSPLFLFSPIPTELLNGEVAFNKNAIRRDH